MRHKFCPLMYSTIHGHFYHGHFYRVATLDEKAEKAEEVEKTGCFEKMDEKAENYCFFCWLMKKLKFDGYILAIPVVQCLNFSPTMVDDFRCILAIPGVSFLTFSPTMVDDIRCILANQQGWAGYVNVDLSMSHTHFSIHVSRTC